MPTVGIYSESEGERRHSLPSAAMCHAAGKPLRFVIIRSHPWMSVLLRAYVNDPLTVMRHGTLHYPAAIALQIDFAC